MGLPGVAHINHKDLMSHLPLLREADWILFAPYTWINTLYYAVNHRIFPSISSYHLGHDKAEMTRAFQAICPGNVPETHVLANTPIHRDWIWNQAALPFVAKNPLSSQGRGVFLIESRSHWHTYCEQTNLLYAQEYLPIDRDMRLVVVGTKVVCAYWRQLSPEGDGFHTNVSRGGTILTDPIPQAAIDLVESLCARLHIDHGGFDVALCYGRYYIFEFNRLCGNVGLIEHEHSIQAETLAYLQAKLDLEYPTRHTPHRRKPQPRRKAA